MSVIDTLKQARAQRRDENKFRAWAITAAGRANQERLKALCGRHRGRRGVVMGNGPSLLKVDLNDFALDVTIVSNAHFLVWGDLTYIPTFLTVEDRLVAEDRAEELRQIEGTTKLFPFDLMETIGPAGDDTIYVNFPRRYPGFPRFSHDLAQRAYWGGTVSFLNLQLASYVGCNPIVLTGFDHSYQVPAERLEGDVIQSTAEDVNHIHPDYFGPGYRWHDPNVDRMESAYRRARVELERKGTRVVNATVGGRLEVFERVSETASL